MSVIQQALSWVSDSRIPHSKREEEGSIFLGTPLFRGAAVTLALLAVGKTPAPYSGHRFRIRVMSTATNRGVEDLLIKIFGRWKSAAANQRYVKFPGSVRW